ncbi:MAG: PQQ-dependent sugar dehydrogenase [Chloroflexi bacterium]|nr:PQQ-dependent sugar dehydrogenase [Chloroflexota bacterium]
MQPTRFILRAFVAAGLLASGVILGSTPAPAQAPFTLKLQPFARNFQQPLDLRQAGDGSDRIYVVQKDGVIRVLHGAQPVEHPFLDIRTLVGSSGSEQGLLGLAFDPRYAANGFFYVNYTDPQGDSVVARFQVSDDPDTAEPSTATVILTQKQPFPNHNGGNLVFGPDGYLYVGFGDGGSGGDPYGNAQNGATWLGKLLRIDVRTSPYVIPQDNPFVNTPGTLPEIWALGLRNPWRYTFDRATGDLYIGDVGQNNWEEVDFVPAGSAGGQNFGWNVGEGNHCYKPANNCDLGLFVPAVSEYAHGRGDCAVVGGYVYRGAAYPNMQGFYVYADECSGRVWALTRDGNGAWSAAELATTGVSISAFGEDDGGELYATGLSDGVVYHLTVE